MKEKIQIKEEKRGMGGELALNEDGQQVEV